MFGDVAVATEALLRDSGVPVVLAVNQVDRISDKGSLLPFLAQARTAAGADPSLTTGAMTVLAQLTMIPAALAASLPLPVEVLAASGVFASKVGFASPDDDLNLLTTAGLGLGGDR